MLGFASVRSVLVPVFIGCVLATISVGISHGADPVEVEVESPHNPLMLDVAKHFLKDNGSPRHYKSFSGRQEIGGLPFQIDGQVRFYGRTNADRGTTFPAVIEGIRIGRKFNEIHLVHHSTWPDAQSETVAHVVLNYADGTKYTFPIRYGVHVRDWFNLPSYEKETMADPDTSICWRGKAVAYKAPMRIFKSKFENPLQDKVVETMSVVSAQNMATYNLMAATVADSSEPEPAEPAQDRDFDGLVTIRVLDDSTGKPIKGALVEPTMTVKGFGLVGSPVRTSPEGKGTIPYPTEDTKSLGAQVKKEGFQSGSKQWNSPAPKEFTIRLKPAPETE